MSLEKFSRSGQLSRWPARQKGALTMISAVMILILLTEMVIYAAQVGVFEQRKSANEMRHKEAFHVADSALQFGKEYLLANSRLVASNEDDVLGTADGWLSAAGSSWRLCADADLSAGQGAHPCFAEAADNDTDFPADLRSNMYFYMTDTTGDPDDLDLAALPVEVTAILADDTQQVEMYALLCMLDIDRTKALLDPPEPIVVGCTTVLDNGDDIEDDFEQDDRYFMVTLLSRGQADCSGVDACTATALVADKIGSFGPGGGEGGPGAPLVSRTTLPEGSSTDIVPNPNGGGEGVPTSVWIDADAATVDGIAGNAWATCERHEWYEVDFMPADFRCPTPSRICTCSGKRQLSHGEPGKDQHLDIDVVLDPDFPPDLFKYVFGVTGDAAGVDYVKGLADFIIPGDTYADCSELDEDAYGLIWVADECDIGSNALIGSYDAPVLLVVAGGPSRFNGGVEIFGLIFITDVADATTDFSGIGNLTIYGSIMADADLSKFGGNLKLVYHEDVLEDVLQKGGFGPVAGAWSDFHQDWR